jgi:hypothetical protein
VRIISGTVPRAAYTMIADEVKERFVYSSAAMDAAVGSLRA